MQGKSTDLAKHALPSIPKQRVLVTFTKSQPKSSLPSDSQRLGPPVTSHWTPPPSRTPNHMRHQLGPKHYPTVPATGVLPAPPSIRAPPNGMQTLFVPAAVAPPISFPTAVPIPPGSTGWASAPQRHPPPRMPVPGTGVFLPPPGSGTTSSQHLPDGNLNGETTSATPGKESWKSNHNTTNSSPKDKVDGNMVGKECNGNADGTEGEEDVVGKDDESNDTSDANH